MLKELKKPTTYKEQMQILKSRGCLIENEEECLKSLENLNYYRLTAYFLPFRQTDGKYIEGLSFTRVRDIYEFDRELRLFVFSIVEEIEISLRSRLAHYHAHKYGAVGYMSPCNFNNRHNHDKFLEKFNQEIESNKNVPFVKHHIEKYGRQFPIWVATELFTFGMLSFFYADMTTRDRKEIARGMYNTTATNMESWLKCCTDLRNICAHYGRLYYRIFAAIPAGVVANEDDKRCLWGTMLFLKELYPDSVKWNNEVVPNLRTIVEKYRASIDLRHIAFPGNWHEVLLIRGN